MEKADGGAAAAALTTRCTACSTGGGSPAATAALPVEPVFLPCLGLPKPPAAALGELAVLLLPPAARSSSTLVPPTAPAACENAEASAVGGGRPGGCSCTRVERAMHWGLREALFIITFGEAHGGYDSKRDG